MVKVLRQKKRADTGLTCYSFKRYSQQSIQWRRLCQCPCGGKWHSLLSDRNQAPRSPHLGETQPKDGEGLITAMTHLKLRILSGFSTLTYTQVSVISKCRFMAFLCMFFTHILLSGGLTVMQVPLWWAQPCAGLIMGSVQQVWWPQCYHSTEQEQSSMQTSSQGSSTVDQNTLTCLKQHEELVQLNKY